MPAICSSTSCSLATMPDCVLLCVIISCLLLSTHVLLLPCRLLQLFRVGKFLVFLRVVQVLLLVEWVGGRRKPLPTTASMLNVLCSCSSCVLPVHPAFLCAFVSLGISIKQAKRFGDRRQTVLQRSRPPPGITSGLVTGAHDL